MAETTEKRVKITVPRGNSREDPNVFVGINGKNFLIPKGKTSSVPDYVAAELERAKAADDYQKDEAYARQSANLG